MLDNLEDPESRERGVIILPYVVALAGDRDGAIRLTEMIEDSARRDEAVSYVVLSEILHHDFAGGMKTVGLT